MFEIPSDFWLILSLVTSLGSLAPNQRTGIASWCRAEGYRKVKSIPNPLLASNQRFFVVGLNPKRRHNQGGYIGSMETTDFFQPILRH